MIAAEIDGLSEGDDGEVAAGINIFSASTIDFNTDGGTEISICALTSPSEFPFPFPSLFFPSSLSQSPSSSSTSDTMFTCTT